MRTIIDVVNNSKNDITKEELMKYFSLDKISSEEIKPLKVLYYFNISGFFIPLKPSICDNALSSIEGWIELALKEKKIEYHENDLEKSRTGDIDVDDFHIITDAKESNRFIRIPDYYIYTSIHLNVKKKNFSKINLTGEDIYMLDDSKNINEITICDSHEDGA